jgi:hypothetical protein
MLLIKHGCETHSPENDRKHLALVPAGKSLENCTEKQPTSIALWAYNEADSKYEMTEPTNAASFKKIVQWAYSALPEVH